MEEKNISIFELGNIEDIKWGMQFLPEDYKEIIYLFHDFDLSKTVPSSVKTFKAQNEYKIVYSRLKFILEHKKMFQTQLEEARENLHH